MPSASQLARKHIFLCDGGQWSGKAEALAILGLWIIVPGDAGSGKKDSRFLPTLYRMAAEPGETLPRSDAQSL